jgi:outer membrane autotransporter protein
MANIGQAYVSAMALGGIENAKLVRDFTPFGADVSRSSRFDSRSLAGRFEAGYHLPLAAGDIRATPFVALQPAQVWQDGAGESSGEGVRFDAAEVPALPLHLGAQFDSSVTLGESTKLTPFLRAAWMYDFLPERIVTRTFTVLPDFTLRASGIAEVEDAAILRAGLGFAAGDGINISASLNSQLSGSYRSIGTTVQVDLAW